MLESCGLSWDTNEMNPRNIWRRGLSGAQNGKPLVAPLDAQPDCGLRYRILSRFLKPHAAPHHSVALL